MEAGKKKSGKEFDKDKLTKYVEGRKSDFVIAPLPHYRFIRVRAY